MLWRAWDGRGAIRRRLAAGLLALAVGTAWTGCGSGASASASAADASFLASVHDNAPDIASYRSDVSLVRLGHAACDGFRAGVSYQQLADRLALLQGRHAVPTADLGAVITAAVASYCPQYQSLVG